MNYFLLIENKSFWQFDISDLIQVLVAIVPLLILFLTFRNERKNKRKELKEKTIILYNQLFNKLSKFNQYWINEFENKEEMVKSRISLSLDNGKFDLLVIEIRELEQYFFEQEAEINMIMSLYFKKFYHEYEQHRNDISQYIQILRKKIINHSDKGLDYFLNHNLNNIIIKLDPLWGNILDSHFEIKLKGI